MNYNFYGLAVVLFGGLGACNFIKEPLTNKDIVKMRKGSEEKNSEDANSAKMVSSLDLSSALNKSDIVTIAETEGDRTGTPTSNPQQASKNK